MDIKFADRMRHFEDGIFSVLNEKRLRLIKEGMTVYDFSVGTPDFIPEEAAMKTLIEAAKNPINYRYAISDIPELTEAVIKWYKYRYNVDLTAEEIMSVNGSQEGLAHIGLTLFNPGDICLVPAPRYPIFEIGPFLSGAQVEYYHLKEENNYELDLSSIPEELAVRAKAILVSYPANPVSAAVDPSFYPKLIEWAQNYNVIVIHDNAYSEMTFEGYEGTSFLSFEGAKDIGVEFNSLSKAYNLTGARISFCIGNSKIVSEFRKLRSQIDYGVFLPIQYAAAAALNSSRKNIEKNRDEYKRRREVLSEEFGKAGLPVKLSTGSMFMWTRLPEKYKNSNDFVIELMEKTGVIVTPGSAFGDDGEGYIRIALTKTVDEIRAAAKAIKDSGMFEK
ncbi:LL-diaminopimelate aminotransferase [Clostridiales bacterium]|nr:LL-diaminopimelate aminotransferase [Clostridiales bacterium]